MNLSKIGLATMLRHASSFAALLIVAQPGFTAPVADAHWHHSAMALFPAIEAIDDAQLAPATKTALALRRKRIQQCNEAPRCTVMAARWTPEEVNALAATARSSETQDDIRRQLRGLNNILDVYGLGVPPRVPEIDGPPPGRSATTGMPANVENALWLTVAARADPSSRLDPSIGLALALLDASGRDEAAAYEPLDARFNADAFAKARQIDWRQYRYSAIIIPGVGPDDLKTPLSARGKLNVRMAAERLAQGLAPFVIFSGSNVHPRGTHFVEAFEMRKALIERYGVAPDRIIVEPYARHTTTNLRNATRRLIALGAPLDKDALIVTNPEQSRYIEGAEFYERNKTELGYQPGKIGSRLSANDLVFRPSTASAKIDPMDPLDP